MINCPKVHSYRKTQGYTLIELLIVVTIGVIIFSVGIASYREFSRRQDLLGVSKKMVADLRLAQQLALTGQKPEGSSCSKLIGYTFERTSASGYALYANCDNGGVVSNVETKTLEFDTNVTFTATTNSIQFKVLGQGTNLLVDNVFTLSNSVSGNTAVITVGVGGNIR